MRAAGDVDVERTGGLLSTIMLGSSQSRQSHVTAGGRDNPDA